jgi:hypothetical protein
VWAGLSSGSVPVEVDSLTPRRPTATCYCIIMTAWGQTVKSAYAYRDAAWLKRVQEVYKSNTA